MPGLPVHHQLPEFTQTHVHWVSDAIQPSHPLSSPSPPAFNLSHHQGLFKCLITYLLFQITFTFLCSSIIIICMYLTSEASCFFFPLISLLYKTQSCINLTNCIFVSMPIFWRLRKLHNFVDFCHFKFMIFKFSLAVKVLLCHSCKMHFQFIWLFQILPVFSREYFLASSSLRDCFYPYFQ